MCFFIDPASPGGSCYRFGCGACYSGDGSLAAELQGSVGDALLEGIVLVATASCRGTCGTGVKTDVDVVQEADVVCVAETVDADGEGCIRGEIEVKSMGDGNHMIMRAVNNCINSGYAVRESGYSKKNIVKRSRANQTNK